MPPGELLAFQGKTMDLICWELERAADVVDSSAALLDRDTDKAGAGLVVFALRVHFLLVVDYNKAIVSPEVLFCLVESYFA